MCYNVKWIIVMNNMSKYDLYHSSLGGDFLNNSGIYSLAGFIYQIKAFIYYLADLNENNQIGFEAYDDVSLCKKDIAESQKTDEIFSRNDALALQRVYCFFISDAFGVSILRQIYNYLFKYI